MRFALVSLLASFFSDHRSHWLQSERQPSSRLILMTAFGTKRTSRLRAVTSASDPKRTLSPGA